LGLGKLRYDVDEKKKKKKKPQKHPNKKTPHKETRNQKKRSIRAPHGRAKRKPSKGFDLNVGYAILPNL